MRSNFLLACVFTSACYTATGGGAEICSPVATSWESPVWRCEAPRITTQAFGSTGPRTEVTDAEIKLHEKVEFETDSATLLPSSTPILDEVAKVLTDHPEIEHVRVGGHTDSTASSEHNLKLSDDRAASVKQYLVDHGIAPERLSSKGYGETRPIADNNTEEGRALNRRVDIHIMRRHGESQDRQDKP